MDAFILNWTSLFSVDCTWSTWSSWSTCSKTCGSGSMTRSRSTNGPFYGGNACTGLSSESASCNTNICPGKFAIFGVKSSKGDPNALRTRLNAFVLLFSVDCTWSAWGPWSTCSKTCDSGSMTRSRSTNGPFHGGIACSGLSSESAPCNTNSCPGRK